MPEGEVSVLLNQLLKDVPTPVSARHLRPSPGRSRTRSAAPQVALGHPAPCRLPRALANCRRQHMTHIRLDADQGYSQHHLPLARALAPRMLDARALSVVHSD